MAASALHFESPRRHSLARTLSACITVSVVAVAVLVAVVSVRLSRERILHELRSESHELAERLAMRLELHLWNVDVPAINKYLVQAPLPRDVAFVRVLNEFQEPLAESGSSDPTPIVATEPVHHGRELIGFVQTGMSMRQVTALQQALVEYTVAIALIGSTVLALVAWLTTGLVLRRPLASLTAGLKRIADGDYESRLPTSSFIEIDEINGEVNTMAQIIALRTRQLETEVRERRRAEVELRAMAGDLETLVDERTRALSLTNRRLADEISRRKQAQDEILAISSYEQRRIGQDLHDSLGQELAGAAFLCGSLTRAMGKVAPNLAEQADQLTSILSQAVSETRRIAHGLTPVEPADGGLVDALKALCADASHMFGVQCSLRVHTTPGQQTDPTASTHLYRIAQEAIHNAVRHGHASRVVVTLRENRETSLGTLSIEDDGSGMPATDRATPGLGMRTMRYRAEALGGRVDVTATACGGTMVMVEYGLAGSALSDSELARL